MPWTPATFVASRPEFAPTLAADVAGSRTVVQTALNDALAQCDARVFGANQDLAVSLYAAHLLSVGPYGQQARLDTGDKKKVDESTTYLREWNALSGKKGGGGWTAGQLPGGQFIRPVGCW